MIGNRVKGMHECSGHGYRIHYDGEMQVCECSIIDRYFNWIVDDACSLKYTDYPRIFDIKRGLKDLSLHDPNRDIVTLSYLSEYSIYCDNGGYESDLKLHFYDISKYDSEWQEFAELRKNCYIFGWCT